MAVDDPLVESERRLRVQVLDLMAQVDRATSVGDVENLRSQIGQAMTVLAEVRGRRVAENNHNHRELTPA